MKRDRLRQYQRRLAPGTPLRAGLDRILHGRTGALVVLGNNAKVQQVSTGGFQLNVDFTPQALRELAKLDGAIILSNDLSRIIAAGVHLVPAGDLPTAETGTRHRSADRTAQASGVPVVTVSASMSTISLFMDGDRHPVETSGQMISRANQTLATLARFVDRLGDILHQFNALEVGEQVTIRSLVLVAQRFEMTRRLSAETQFHIDTLGVEGRLIALQHAELVGEFTGLDGQLATDYSHSRGARLLISVGRLPEGLVTKLIDRFSLQELFSVSVSELQQIDGIGAARARLIRDALLRITEAAYARPQAPV